MLGGEDHELIYRQNITHGGRTESHGYGQWTSILACRPHAVLDAFGGEKTMKVWGIGMELKMESRKMGYRSCGEKCHREKSRVPNTGFDSLLGKQICRSENLAGKRPTQWEGGRCDPDPRGSSIHHHLSKVATCWVFHR